jgi:hypothetical protein
MAGASERLSVGILAKPTDDQIQRARIAARHALHQHPRDADAARTALRETLDALGLLDQ